MSEPLAGLVALAAGVYLGLGALFAIVFAASLAGRLDAAAARGSWGFRLLILPGAILLWPFLVLRLRRSP